jgi:hypothetical protein
MVFDQPCIGGSNGPRAIPRIFSTAGSRSSAVTAEMPISPVGPVTATVSPICAVFPFGARRQTQTPN